MIAFASSFPGEIRAFQITPDKTDDCAKSAFWHQSGCNLICAFSETDRSRLFFGGEGFIMQRLDGYGTAFIEIDGSIVEYSLGPGSQLLWTPDLLQPWMRPVPWIFRRCRG